MSSDFFQKVADAAASDAPAWLATVVATAGSTPARIGMKMIIHADGSIVGTIGGGELEKLVIDKVRAELPTAAAKWDLDLGSQSGAQLATSMICGGVQEILVEPLRLGVPLVIFGGGHCGMALSFLASWAGFAVTVVDDRKEWASTAKHPKAARVVCMSYDDVPGALALGPDSYAVIMTHGHVHDGLVLRRLLEHRLAFLGMLGSKGKVRELFDALRAEGIGDERLAQVVAPIGVSIGSHTPEEIAVSIVAQMIGRRNGIAT